MLDFALEKDIFTLQKTKKEKKGKKKYGISLVAPAWLSWMSYIAPAWLLIILRQFFC